MKDQRIRLHVLHNRGIDGEAAKTAAIVSLHALGMDARLVDDIDFADHAVDVGLQFVAHAVVVEIFAGCRASSAARAG